MDTVERETILIVLDSKQQNAEVEKVIIYKDRETALDAFFGQFWGRSILTMAEVNREVKQVQPGVVQDVLLGMSNE